MAEEKLFEGHVKQYLHSVGVYPAGYPSDRMKTPVRGWYTKIWGGGFQKAGIPDLLACINGFMVAVEIKASKGVKSELQKLNVKRINAGNGIAIFLYPEGFDNFKKLVEGVLECDIHIARLNALKNANSSTKCDIWTE